MNPVSGFDTVESARRERIRRALDKKLPKLGNAGTQYLKVLILESDDLALSNVLAIARAFKEIATERSDLPDFVYLTEFDTVPLTVWTLKNQQRLLPDEGSFEDRDGLEDA